MPYVCRMCEYYEDGGAPGMPCPECGGAMRFTMVGTATLDEDPPIEDWNNPYQFGYDEIESPWKFRYGQIGVGISTYWVFTRINLLIPILFVMAKTDMKKAATAIFALRLMISCIGAFAGGAMSGFWTRAWITQALGVVVGVSIVPLFVTLVLFPLSFHAVLMNAGVALPVAILGAYIGHLIVPPTRVPHI